MQQFPEDFNQQTCRDQRTHVQDVSLCTCRQHIYDITVSNRRRGYEVTYFNMPTDLGWKNGKCLCEELLLRFNSLDVTFEIADEDYIETTPRYTFINIDGFRKTTALLEEHQPTIVQLKFHY